MSKPTRGKHRAVYVGGRLVAPGPCPLCGGSLIALRCQRPACGQAFASLQDLQPAYAEVDAVVAELKPPNSGGNRLAPTGGTNEG